MINITLDHHVMRLLQDTTFINFRFYSVLEVIIIAPILVRFGFYLFIAN